MYAHPGALEPREMARLLVDELRTIDDPKAHSILRDAGLDAFTAMLAELLSVSDSKRLQDMKAKISLSKRNQFVEACPEHVELGRCEVQSSSAELTWTAIIHRYDATSTRDSDASMRQCLTLGGHWSAPARDDVDASMEAARQHALALKQLLR